MNRDNTKIAVIGMACKFPGADNLEQFWKNLVSGKDTLTHFTDEELAEGERDYINHFGSKDYVKARGILNDADKFDAGFFGMTPKDAAGTDPQLRLWLETAWEAFENAGCDPLNYKGAIGVFAGGTMSSYLFNNILSDPKKMESFRKPGFADDAQIMIGNDISFMSSRTAYNFNLKGPAIFVQTACSTSLVAITQACQSLFSFESDVCLAGGVRVTVPQEKGYVYQEGAILSPDGTCRPFDEKSAGIVGSNGVGAVILKRLDDALEDHDTIYAVVSGWAMNNDGSNKVSYTAPSVDGQAEVIMMAQSLAEVSPAEISYIEAHGTATSLGDPIEIGALTKVFSAKTPNKQFCGIGSVKSNIGHTDSAAGVAGFIKTCLAAYYKKIPASLYYTKPNPQIDFDNSPFFVQKDLREWNEDKPLVMGVSSFGIGGTNSHVIIEEPPVVEDSYGSKSDWPYLMVLSAKSEFSLARRKVDLVEFIKSNPKVNLEDVAYTLESGRNHMPFRSFFVAKEIDEIKSDSVIFNDGKKDNLVSKVAFMFPGQGAQYVNMGADLYRSNNTFRKIVDECLTIVKSETGTDLHSILFDSVNPEEAGVKLSRTDMTQPALFIIEYALAKVLEELDIKPDYLIGHSIGEYAAACIAGVFDMQTALKIVIKRGQLMCSMPEGSMMAVRTGIETLKGIGSHNFEIAAENSDASCTISFKTEETELVKELLDKNNISYIPLNTSHAFHSNTFDPILAEFAGYVNQFKLSSPQLPFISCLTGDFIRPDQATSGEYWAQQLRNTVLFSKGVSVIARSGEAIFIEVGPNTHLSSIIRQNKDVSNKRRIISTLAKPDDTDESYKIITAIGNIHNLGVSINHSLLRKNSSPHKIFLPGYPFEKKRHWIESKAPALTESIENLSEPDSSSSVTSIETGAVSNNTIGKITEIWKSLTGRDEISPDEDFFEIGGHSLLALQILSRIKEELGFKISLKDFLDNSTINKLYAHLGIESQEMKVLDNLHSEINLSEFPLSYIQKRIWIVSKLDGFNPAYNIPFAYKFTGQMNVDVFVEALNVLFRRHFVMFSLFHERDGNPYCEINPGPARIDLMDYSEEQADKSEGKILDLILEDSRKEFDLEKGPLYRVYLSKQNDSTYFFHGTIHHIIFDGWSFGVLIDDLKVIYDSILLNKELVLEDVKPYYLSYAKFLQSGDDENSYQKSSKFWIENLKGCTPKLDFPYDFPRKDVASGYGEKEMLKFSAETTSKLKEIAKEKHATPYATLLSLIGILYSKYSGQDDICIGTHVANRPHSNLENIFGMFVNTIPVRLRIDDNKNVSSLMNDTREILLESISHQEFPFDKIVEVVNPERFANVNPIFQVAVQWINYSAKPIEMAGLTGTRVETKEGVAPFDITFNLWENGDHYEGEIEYNIDILKRDTIIRLRDNFVQLVRSAVENPDKAILELSIISESDRKMLSEFNNTVAPVPVSFVQSFFEAQSSIRSNETAVLSGSSSLTYTELNEKSNQLARHLTSLGAKGGDVVGVCIERSVDMVVSVLGVLKAGCCYLPMDPSFPDERISYMYEDSGARVLISQSSLNEKFRHFPDTSMVLMDKDIELIGKQDKGRPGISITAHDLAYMIYTSGSTGRPKGVKVHHEAVVNFLSSMSKKPGFSKEDSLLAVTTLSFDISVLEVFMPLSFGGKLVVADTDDIFDGVKLSALLDRHGITVMQATPATWNILLDSGWRGKNDLKALCGGEAIPSGLVKDLLPKVESLWNMYGPTETTVWSTCKHLTDSSTPILVGTPIDNTTIHIVDMNNRELPVGVVGEVCIGGLGVTKGYNNRPELTAEKFIAFEHGGQIYKTGDLGRYLSDGNIELFGRSDNQIKLRGFRIELGEIESLLSQLSGVKEAVVKLHKFLDNDERLVAFLNTEPAFTMTSEEISGSLSQNLPGYMIPSFYQSSPSFPRLPNGKINKKALILEEVEKPKEAEIEFFDLTQTQQKLVRIWEVILKTRNIPTSKSFFDIGGNSLLAIRILNMIKEELGLSLTFKLFISYPTILQQAFYIDSQTQPSGKATEIVHLDRFTNLPLTYNQKRLWLISELRPDIPSYIIPFSYKFSGILDTEVFKTSLNILFQRHHILFSVFRQADGEPYCDIVPSEVNVTMHDFSILPENERREKVDQILNADSVEPFDLANGPLYRIYLITTGRNEYYFRISVHHIIFDGWSWGVFAKDFNDIYNSLSVGKNPILKPLEFQQYDYADLEKKISGSKHELESKEYWENNLKGSSSILGFPYDFQRSNESSGRGDIVSIKFSPQISDKIRQIGKSEGASMFTSILSLFGLQLHKYSGEDDLNIGLPIAHRPHSKLENIFGMFVNTIVVRMEFENQFTIRDIIRRINDSTMNAMAHQDLPFDKVVDIINPERSTTANPLFQVAFDWQNNLGEPLKLKGITAEGIKVKDRTAIFDITLYAWENNGQVEGEIEYNIDILKRDTIIRLRDNFVQLVQSAVENPDKAILELSIISESDRKMLSEFNNTVEPVPVSFVQSFFEDQSSIRSKETAVISGSSSLTYKELNEKSNQLARHLTSLGAKGGDVVGICIERSVDMVVSVLGVLKAGCCYLPMDPSFPDERISYMYEDSGARVLISQSSLNEKFRHFPDTSMVLMDKDSELIGKQDKGRPDIGITAHDLAYMIYTSGSTGKPKGVKVHHEAVVNFLSSMSKKPGFSKEDSLLAVTTLSFDISVLEVFMPLSFGGKLVVADTDDIFDGVKLSALLDQHGITVMQATPATWNILLGSGWKGKNDVKALCGGEAIPSGLVNDLLPKVESLWNMYGPTETTVWSTCKQLTDSSTPILVGTPIDNTTIHIVDRNNRELPVGVVGEVCIGGLGVTKGYNNRPELTAEKFIAFEHGGQIYKTGDLGRYLSDGNIELFGRSDNQIKLRGFRIELGEIESLLSQLSGVKEAVVKLHKFRDNDERLVAFLNTEPVFSMTAEEISGSLSQNLPGYMIPSFYQSSLGFPRLPNGKINKKALIFETIEEDESAVIDLENYTSTQRKLIEIWEAILNTKRVTLTRNFFDMGGNSMLAIKTLNKIKEDFGITMTFKTFIGHPTIAQLSGYIDSQSKSTYNRIELVHLNRTTDLPLSLNQKRLWIISEFQPDMPSYIIPFSFRFTGKLNLEIFNKSLNTLFRRHHILFSVFRSVHGEPVCDIVQSDINITSLDYSMFSEQERAEKITKIFNDDSVTPFNLSSGPLYRIYLVKTGTDEYFFRISIHHIIFDGWSWGVLTKDLSTIYNSLLKGSDVNLEAIEFQQYDYAYWEMNSAGSQHEEQLKEFWKSNLEGSSSLLNFPYDYPRSKNISGKGQIIPMKFSKEVTAKLRKISKAEGVSMFTTVLSAFGFQMHTYSGEDDINIGLPIAYRPHSKLENIFGMFVNTVVVRLKRESGLTFRKLIHYTTEAAMNAIAHQDLPFEKVVEIVKPERFSNTNPLFQVAFDWHNNLSNPLHLEGITSEYIAGTDRSAIFDITLYIKESGDHIISEIEYNTDLLKSTTIERLRDNFIHSLENLAEYPDKDLSEISVVSEQDLMLLSTFNKTSIDVSECLIQNLFEQQSELNATKIAVVSGDTSLTYQELEEQSNQMANYLMSQGVKQGDVVGVCIERSANMIVSVLGVLKAGCCYLPMDPSFPDDRISFMYEDSGARVLISQSSLKGKFTEFKNTTIVFTDTDNEKIGNCSSQKPDLSINPQSLAYIIYTSGSTGTPKGVKVHHESVVNLIESMSQKPGIKSSDILLAVVTLSFDMSVYELFLPLSAGATIVVATAKDTTNGQSIIDLIDEHNITMLQATPSLWNILLASGWKGKSNLRAFCGGEALTRNMVRQILPKVAEFWNCYGPTETTVYATFIHITDPDAPILIGRPLNNTTIQILDKNNIELPVGVIGEVCIGGLCVTKGYNKRPELTAEKFIPFGDGQTIYKTGDFGRYLIDGNIELFGRIDNQFKIRGFRIEPGEIESLLSRLPGIKEAVVKIHKFDENDERLVAFLNTEEEFKLDKEKIITALANRLPAYMIPSFFQVSVGFPRLPNGKINKKALLLELHESHTLDNEHIKALTPTERTIHNIWLNALKTEDILVTDNFFAVGGNSLLAISVFSKIEHAFSIKLGLRVFFDSPRIRDIAEIIDILKGKDVEPKSARKDASKKHKIIKGEL